MLLIVGISGASGAIYGIRLLEVLSINKQVETHLIISEAGEKNIKYETDWEVEQVKALADYCYDIHNTGAKLAKDLGLAEAGDLIVITGGVPIGVAGSTNLLKVEKIS